MSPNAVYTHESYPFTFGVQLNSDGFRDVEFPGSPRENTIVFAGDSFTFGWGVYVGDGYVERADQFINEQSGTKWHVYNLGVEGTAPPHIFDVVSEFGPRLKPDILVLTYLANNDNAYKFEEAKHRLAALALA